jgi:hypothetical protein
MRSGEKAAADRVCQPMTHVMGACKCCQFSGPIDARGASGSRCEEMEREAQGRVGRGEWRDGTGLDRGVGVEAFICLDARAACDTPRHP